MGVETTKLPLSPGRISCSMIRPRLVSASKKNRLCKKFFSKKDDALSLDWPSGSSLYVNFPYGRIVAKWFEKGWDAARRGSTVVYLVPCRTDTRVFHEWMLRGFIFMIKGRLSFLYNNNVLDAAPFPSAIVVYNKKLYNRYMTYGNHKPLVDTIDFRIGNLYSQLSIEYQVCIDCRNAWHMPKIIRYPRDVKRYPRIYK